MVGKIDLVEDQGDHSYVLKIYPDASDQPKFLFHCSYLNKSKKEALIEAQDYKKKFSKTHNIPLEEGLES